MHKLSLIIPVYNSLAEVKICLERLAPGLTGMEEGQCEVLVINDASNAECTAYLRDFAAAGLPGCHLRLQENESNQGYLNNVNAGLAATDGEICVLLNSDTALPTGAARRILACFESDPKIGLASPVASHCGLFSIPFKPGLSPLQVDLMDAKIRQIAPQYPEAILPDGFCFCLRRELFQALGGFDLVYAPGYWEEYDLGMRARAAGWRTVLIDNIYVYHKAQASFGSKRNRDLQQRNEKLFMERWGDTFRALRDAHPREEHKPRLYALIYSLPERIWRKTLRFLAQAIPFSNLRRRIRRDYN